MKLLRLAILLLALASPTALRAKPLNVLVLYADDWRHDTLGCAGHPVVKTPHLDRLAGDCVRFTRNHVTTSICGVSRATLFTGQWMSRHGNPGFKMFQTPWAETYPGLLRAMGYFTGHIGKWHNGKFPAENFDFARPSPFTHWNKLPDGTRLHVMQRNENDALEFLRTRPADKPFCLTLAFFATHAEDGNKEQFLPNTPKPQTAASCLARLSCSASGNTCSGRRRTTNSSSTSPPTRASKPTSPRRETRDSPCRDAASGVAYLDATISGNSEQVRRGEALCLVGGEAADHARCGEVFRALGCPAIHVGGSGDGARMKLVTNLVLGLNRAALAEGLALAEAMGLELRRTLQVLQSSAAYSRIMDSKGGKMIAREFSPVARLSQHLKDVRLIQQAGEAGGLRLPLTEAHRHLLERAEAAGLGPLDNSAVIEIIRRKTS